MLKIGITGGIGTVKSFVSKIITSMGYPVFDSDKAAKKILMQSNKIHQKLRTHFGDEIFLGNLPDTKKIAALVFNSKEKLDLLNQIIHPEVKKTFEHWVLKQNSRIVFKEAAILIESGSYKDCDKIILVIAPDDLRINRVMKRDSISEEQVRQRILNQMKSEDLKPFTNFIIENDECKPLLPQINGVLIELNKIC
jgi:dephospho-CoA kinase